MTTTDTSSKPLFTETPAINRQMNALIKQGVSHKQGEPLASRPTNDRALALDQLTTAHAEAIRAGNEDEAELMNLQIDRLVESARSGSTDAPRNEDGTFATFDGGARGHKPKPTPGGVREPTTMNGAILAALGRL